MKNLFFVLVFILGLSIVQPASGQDNHLVNCILLDKTLSMTGSGGGQNIWPDVQDYCYSWADGIKVPSTIVFFTYAKDLSDPQIFEIKSDADKGKVKNAIKNVNINGRHTWIASNLTGAWNYLCKNYPESIKRVYLITDGKEEEMGSSIGDVIDKYDATRGDYDYMYYVDLNNCANAETEKAFEGSVGAQIVKEFPKFYTLKPSFKEIGYTIGKSKVLEQRLEVENGDVSDFSFKASIESVTNVDKNDNKPNVTISPETVHFKDLTKDGGAYKYNFNINFHNKSECPCDISIKLEGKASKGNSLNFVPGNFIVKVKNKKNPIVDVKDNNVGWKVKD